MHATIVGDVEREAVWHTLEEDWPGYRGYERASGRVLRIFRLVPTPDAEHRADADGVLRRERGAR